MNAVVITPGSSAIGVAALLLASTQLWMMLRAARIPGNAPDRLVAELRLAQFSALLLAAVAASSIGFVATQNDATGALDVAIALTFIALSAIVTQREPREALGALAVAFVAHALADVLHLPGWLSADLIPKPYLLGCAVFNGCSAVICYWPLFRR